MDNEREQRNLQCATRLRDLFQDAGLTLSVMESCSGGLLASALTDVPGSGYLLGGAITYDTGVKQRFGVPAALIESRGVVSAEVAQAMARSCARWFQTDVGAAITGVAGPAPQDGCEPGTFFVAVWSPERGYAVERGLVDDSREGVKAEAVRWALELLERETRELLCRRSDETECTPTEAWIG